MACHPCKIPKADLTLSWTNSSTGPGSTTLSWNGTAWNSACTNGLLVQLSCVSGLVLTVTYFISVNCPSGQGQSCTSPGSVPFAITLASSTCNPFQLNYTVQSAGCPAGWTAGYTSFTITGPAYGSSTCCQTFAFQCGCVPVEFSGATVNVYDHAGGTLLATGTTDASGVVSLVWPGPCNVYVTATPSAGGIFSYANSLTLTNGGMTRLGCSHNTLYLTYQGIMATLNCAGGQWLSDNVAIPTSKTVVDQTGVIGSCVEPCIASGTALTSFQAQCNADGTLTVALHYWIFPCNACTQCALLESATNFGVVGTGISENAVSVSGSWNCATGGVSISGTFPGSNPAGSCSATGLAFPDVPGGGGSFVLTN